MPETKKLLEDWETLKQEVGAKDDIFTRDQEERVAQSFEQYLRKGEPPSEALRGIFERFRIWLMDIYKDMRRLGKPVTDQMINVFDRWLASDEQIRHRTAWKAKRVRGTVTPELTDAIANIRKSSQPKAPAFELRQVKANRYQDYTRPSAKMLDAMHNVVATLNDSFEGKRIGIEVDGQGGTNETVGYKGNSPEWFKALNKDGSGLTKAYVEKVVQKVADGKPLGLREWRIAEAVFGEAVNNREENIRQYLDSRSQRDYTSNPDIQDKIERAGIETDGRTDQQVADDIAAYEQWLSEQNQNEQDANAEREAIQAENAAFGRILEDNPDMVITDEDGNVMMARDALKMADEEIARADKEDILFDEAVNCFLRYSDEG